MFRAPVQLLAVLAASLFLVACSLLEDDAAVSLGFQPDLAEFSDATEQSGLQFQHGAFRWDESGDAVAMMGGGLCWLDYDQNGWLDLYVVNNYALAEAGRWETEEGGLPRNALFRNVEGQFSDISEGSGADLSMRGNGC
ncbi:MAG TPA: hypothetical protein VLE70_11075, partial [Anaerolineae bacterium]|nr:hypothetical protein [Anaerolineae bacterium]